MWEPCFKRGSYHAPDPLPERKGEAEKGLGDTASAPAKGATPLWTPALRQCPSRDKENEPSSLWEIASNAACITPLPPFEMKGGAEIGAGGHPQGPRQRGYAPLDSRSQAMPIKGNEPSSLWELASNAARTTPLAAFLSGREAAEKGLGDTPSYAPWTLRQCPSRDKEKEPSSLWELASNAARITPLAAFFQEGGSSNRGWGTLPVPPPKGLPLWTPATQSQATRVLAEMDSSR